MYAYIDASCPICLQAVGKVAILRCGHGVCYDCIREFEDRANEVYVPRRQLPIPPPQVPRSSTNESHSANVRNLEPYAHFLGIGRESIYDTATIVIDGRECIWVKYGFSFHDWTLYDVVSGYIAYILAEPSSPHSEPRTEVSWSKRSKRWRAC